MVADTPKPTPLIYLLIDYLSFKRQHKQICLNVFVLDMG